MLAQSWAVLAGASSASAASVDEFYKVFAANAFTLLGLWLAVVQLRFKEGAGAPVRRRHAYATAMFFVLPGVMSLAATIDPDQPLLWRIAFSGVGALGILEILLYVTGGIPHSRGATWLRVLGALVYLLIVVVALLPDVAAALDLGARQVEAVLLGVVLVIGVHLFWFGVTTPNPDAEIE